jgi:hypothetical protein
LEDELSTLSHIRLELAREKGHPEGDAGHGYHLYVPLAADGRIDVAAFAESKILCHAVRFRPGEPDARAQLRHGRGNHWYLDYREVPGEDDEEGFRFGDEQFVVGEYVSIREDDGLQHTFRVVAVGAA